MASDTPLRAASIRRPTIGSGGAQDVYGDSYSATIGTGGNQYVESGGFAEDAATDAGGYQYVKSGRRGLRHL